MRVFFSCILQIFRSYYMTDAMFTPNHVSSFHIKNGHRCDQAIGWAQTSFWPWANAVYIDLRTTCCLFSTQFVDFFNQISLQSAYFCELYHCLSCRYSISYVNSFMDIISVKDAPVWPACPFRHFAG